MQERKLLHEGAMFPFVKCDSKLSKKGNLLQHIKTKQYMMASNFLVINVTKATKMGNLLTHIKSIHEGVKYPCDQCDYKATQKGHLLKRKKSIHEGAK